MRSRRRAAQAVRKFTPGLSAPFLLLCAVSVGLATALVPASTSAAATATTSLSSSLGAYAGPANPSGVGRFDRQIGSMTTWAMDYLAGTSWSTITSPGWFVDHWASSAYHMVWAVPILPCKSTAGKHAETCGANAPTLAEGAKGEFDHYFVTLAKRFVADGQGSAIIRLGWEFNGNWFPWSVGTSKKDTDYFVRYWRDIVTAMRSVAGADFQFEWNPMLGAAVWRSVAPTASYPGNAYVDYIGEDVYDQTSCIDAPAKQCATARGRWSWFLSEPHGLDWVAAFAREHGKALVIPEWGLWPRASDGGGDNVLFVTNMLAWFEAHHVVIATYFDYSTNKLTYYPTALAAFRRVVSGT